MTFLKNSIFKPPPLVKNVYICMDVTQQTPIVSSPSSKAGHHYSKGSKRLFYAILGGFIQGQNNNNWISAYKLSHSEKFNFPAESHNNQQNRE